MVGSESSENRRRCGSSLKFREKTAVVPGQAETLAQIQHFLSIDNSADGLNFSPFRGGALNDPVPWIRDIAAQRLIGSDNCQQSPPCGEALLARVRELLESKIACERYEALPWLEGMIGKPTCRQVPTIRFASFWSGGCPIPMWKLRRDLTRRDGSLWPSADCCRGVS